MSIYEQLIRIALNAGGAYLLGDGVAQSSEFQAGAGALISAISFIWWGIRQYKARNSI